MNRTDRTGRTPIRPLLIVAALTVMLSGMSRADMPLQPVEQVDLDRYQGRWFEIARLPNRFQDHCAGDVSADYTLRDDGRIRVVNRCRTADGAWSEAEGVARRAHPDGSPGALEVRFAPRWLSWLPMVWGDYRILALGEDYEYALVGSKDRKFLWILARTTRLPDAVIDDLLAQARASGFDISDLIMTEHAAD